MGLTAVLIFGGLAIGVVFACTFTDWHQVEIVEEKCEHCSHTHKKYI
jgi:hypothetical protein